jgi:F-type H+-transporting ATPase subunit epsilon
MQVDILNPDKTLFSGEAQVVTLPGVKGSFQILNNHAPLISSLTSGKLVIENGSEKQSFEINGGIVEVLKNKIVVLV